MKLREGIEVGFNIEIEARERGKLRARRQTHNIVTNIGRQFILEAITAQAFSGGGFTRQNNNVIQYIGFGIGGDLQASNLASTSPLSTDYPGTTAQSDTDLSVVGLERPVRVNADPLWMKQVAAPAIFPTATSVRYEVVFSETDINYGPYDRVPLTEIGMFLSSADPALPNGSAGTYPGAGGFMASYDTFGALEKTGQLTFRVRWTYSLTA